MGGLMGRIFDTSRYHGAVAIDRVRQSAGRRQPFAFRAGV